MDALLQAPSATGALLSSATKGKDGKTAIDVDLEKVDSVFERVIRVRFRKLASCFFFKASL
jgi:hypothetical protein